jgi:hypothetical protein
LWIEPNPRTGRSFTSEEILRDPSLCPVCNGFDVKRVVDRATVNPEGEPDKTATGLSGYVCMLGHIFFVRSCDLEEWPEYAEFP